jgi:hypothetical protein
MAMMGLIRINLKKFSEIRRRSGRAPTNPQRKCRHRCQSSTKHRVFVSDFDLFLA